MPGDDPDALAAELFKTFARFEYALKAAEFHKGDGRAEANWRSFAESVAGIFEEPANEEFAQAAAYMLAHPPKKQVVEGGVLGWSVLSSLKHDRAAWCSRHNRLCPDTMPHKHLEGAVQCRFHAKGRRTLWNMLNTA